MARYGIWGNVEQAEAQGRLCVLHQVESHAGYAFFQRIADAVSPGYGDAMASNWDGDWKSPGPDLVYSIDPSEDGTGALAFALVKPKGGKLKITMLMTSERQQGKGIGFLLLKHTVDRCLFSIEEVLIDNGVTPRAKGHHIYGTKMQDYFDVRAEGDFFYYKRLPVNQ